MPRAANHRPAIATVGDLRGMHATVMGLGLHGGGLAAARFLIRHGAFVTVTDLRDETVLGPSLDSLPARCARCGWCSAAMRSTTSPRPT